MDDRKLFMKALGASVREYVENADSRIRTWVSDELKALADLFEERIKSIPEARQGERGERGERGESVKGDRGEPGERGEVGQRGEQGIPGIAGENGPMGPVGEKGERGMAGMVGEKGEAGERGDTGIPGRDAPPLDILPMIDSQRSYPRGTLATHAGGLWWAHKNTLPFDTVPAIGGWQVVVNGTASEVPLKSDNQREFGYVRTLTDGTEMVVHRIVDIPLFCGTWESSGEYVKGDMVHRGGSMYICNIAGTRVGPGTPNTPDWSLCARHGNPGKDGATGSKGDPGRDGRPGRDLTQVDYTTGAKH